MVDLSVVILTYNEELNIDACLSKIKTLTDNVFIIDSYSSDRTLEICKTHNCKIYQNNFINHANQLNWALDNIDFSTEWILRIDADEYLTNDLINEIKQKLPILQKEIHGVFLKRRVYFMNKWIRFGGYYPTKLLRLWRTKKAVCEQRWMDEHMKLLEGFSTLFQEDMVDENSKNLHWWIGKHNDYATKEAIEHLNSKYKLLNSEYVESNLFGSQEQRKRWFKEKAYAFIPLGVRPIIYFIYRYFLKLGFLDGFRGLLFHVLQGFWYRFLIDAKVYEIERKAKKKGLSILQIVKQEYGIKL
tara:strand:+ start:1056 stop:1958 length:903 start_codon:yes stop_codon:yes gene_type:complete